MIKTVKITNHLNESITLDLQNPEKSGFVIKSIDGLGPVKATINFTQLATSDGAVDNSAMLDSRNITMTLGFLENPTIEATRLKSYKYFPVKRNITFLIETDSRICQTTGRVESNEPDIFSQDEGCTISIMCPDPYFYSAGADGDNKVVFYGTEPAFQFEFSNESITDKLIEFGYIENRTEGVVTYSGDAETGMTISMHAVGSVTGITIYNVTTRETMKINDEKLEAIIESGVQAGDDIIITTSRGSKQITLLREGVSTNILNALERPISWFQLSKGDNLFVYTAEDGLSNLQFNIQNKTVYEGV